MENVAHPAMERIANHLSFEELRALLNTSRSYRGNTELNRHMERLEEYRRHDMRLVAMLNAFEGVYYSRVGLGTLNLEYNVD